MYMGRACSTNGEKRNAYRLLVGKPDGSSAIVIFLCKEFLSSKLLFISPEGMASSCAHSVLLGISPNILAARKLHVDAETKQS
jgi:hypothetical protein